MILEQLGFQQVSRFEVEHVLPFDHYVSGFNIHQADVLLVLAPSVLDHHVFGLLEVKLCLLISINYIIFLLVFKDLQDLVFDRILFEFLDDFALFEEVLGSIVSHLQQHNVHNGIIKLEAHW